MRIEKAATGERIERGGGEAAGVAWVAPPPETERGCSVGPPGGEWPTVKTFRHPAGFINFAPHYGTKW